MKQPRTSDFDPNAKKHELKSSLANFPAIEKPPKKTKVIFEPLPGDNSLPRTMTFETKRVENFGSAVTGVRESQGTRVPPKANAKSVRKIKKRHPFDIFEDQVEALKKLSIEDQVEGGIGSMSAMVRDALDTYLAKRSGKRP